MIDEKSIVIVELEDKLIDFIVNYEDVIGTASKSEKTLAIANKGFKRMDSKRDLKQWKESVGYFSLNPRQFNFGLKNL